MSKYKTSLDRSIAQLEKQIERMQEKRGRYTEKIDQLEVPKCKCGASEWTIKVDPDLHKYSVWSGRRVYLICRRCWEVYEINEPGATS